MRKSKKDRLPPFVPVFKEVIKSESFKRLTNASRVAYVLLRAQCRRFDQTEVRFPYSDAEEYMERHTFSRAISQLIKEGYIGKAQEGGMYRRTNVYEIKI